MKKYLLLLPALTAGFSFAQTTGNVGIGTTNPQAQLHTTGTVRFEGLKGPGLRLVYANDSGRLVAYRVDSVANNTPISIPVNNVCGTGATSTINVTGQSTPVASSGIRVRIKLSHPDTYPLFVYLEAPTGQVLNLCYLNFGGPGFANTVFTDNAVQPISAVSQDASGGYPGSYAPNGELMPLIDPGTYVSCASGYAGTVATFGALGSGGFIIPDGSWTLRIIDAGNSAGTLNSWSISFDKGVTPVAPNFVAKAGTGGVLKAGSIYDNGQVGIGTTSPTQMLDVAGTIHAAGYTGDGRNLANVVNTAAAQTISGVKTFSDNLLASSSVGIGTTAPNSSLQVNGSLSLPVKTVNTSYTLTAADYTLLTAGGVRPVTISLPAASGNAGRIYVISRQSGGTVTVSGAPAAYSTIDGTTASCITYQSTGTAWIAISKL